MSSNVFQRICTPRVRRPAPLISFRDRRQQPTQQPTQQQAVRDPMPLEYKEITSYNNSPRMPFEHMAEEEAELQSNLETMARNRIEDLRHRLSDIQDRVVKRRNSFGYSSESHPLRTSSGIRKYPDTPHVGPPPGSSEEKPSLERSNSMQSCSEVGVREDVSSKRLRAIPPMRSMRPLPSIPEVRRVKSQSTYKQSPIQHRISQTHQRSSPTPTNSPTVKRTGTTTPAVREAAKDAISERDQRYEHPSNERSGLHRRPSPTVKQFKPNRAGTILQRTSSRTSNRTLQANVRKTHTQSEQP